MAIESQEKVFREDNGGCYFRRIKYVKKNHHGKFRTSKL